MVRYITEEGKILESANSILREIDVEPFYEIYSLNKRKVLKWQLDKWGYVRVYPYFNGKLKSCCLHRLILSTFDQIGYFDSAHVNHIDEVKTNNRLSNLQWLSKKDNDKHGTRNQRIGDTLLNREDLSKHVLKFTKSGNFIAEYPSINEAQRQTGIVRHNIRKCCNGKRKSAGGFVWKWKTD